MPAPQVDLSTVEAYEALRKQEQQYFTDMVARCKASGADLVICQWGFDDEANHLLMHHKLPAVRCGDIFVSHDIFISHNSQQVSGNNVLSLSASFSGSSYKFSEVFKVVYRAAPAIVKRSLTFLFLPGRVHLLRTVGQMEAPWDRQRDVYGRVEAAEELHPFANKRPAHSSDFDCPGHFGSKL